MRPFDIDRNSGNNFHQGHESDFSHLGTWITSEARGSPIDTESDQGICFTSSSLLHSRRVVNYELLLPTPMTPPRHSPSGGGDQASDGATLAPFEASGLVVVDIPPVPSGTEEDATTCAVGVEDHASQSPSQAAASVQQLEATKEKKR
jgi:hypothetical protein